MSKTIYEQLDELIRLLKKEQSPNTAATTPEDDEYAPLEIFEQMRWYYASIGLVLSITATVITYKYYLPLFAVSFGFFYSFIVIFLLLLTDKFFVPGDSYGKIKESPVAIAIFLFALLISFNQGFQTGSQIISDPFAGEREIRIINEQEPATRSDSNQLHRFD